MTTFPFTPSNISAPVFQPTLDGSVYSCDVRWNLFGNRYYVNCYDSSGGRVFTVPLIETGPSVPVDNMVWDGVSRSLLLTTSSPHGYKIGGTLELTVEGASPVAFNGTRKMLVTGDRTLTFPCLSSPGPLVAPGRLSHLISLCKGYFDSTMVYRNGQFEVTP